MYYTILSLYKVKYITMMQLNTDSKMPYKVQKQGDALWFWNPAQALEGY